GYTRGTLAAVTGTPLTRPTPCADWDLMHLLAHMDDALDAFLEAAAGAVTVPEERGRRHPGAMRPGDRIVVLQEKACTLLGTWMQAAEAGIQQVRVGSLSVPTGLLVGTAALEISVHGWDVAQSTGVGTRLPSDLAAELLPTAHRTVGEQDRP